MAVLVCQSEQVPLVVALQVTGRGRTDEAVVQSLRGYAGSTGSRGIAAGFIVRGLHRRPGLQARLLPVLAE